MQAEQRRRKREAFYRNHNTDDEGVHDAQGRLLHNFGSWRTRQQTLRGHFFKDHRPAPKLRLHRTGASAVTSIK